jgi:hypothetical protein
MDNVKLPKLPRTSIGLLGVAYILLGWYLSAYHVVWLVGVLVVFFTIAVAWKTNPIVELLLKLFGSQSLVVVISLSLLVSCMTAFVAVEPQLATILTAPTVSTLLATLDLQSAGVRPLEAFVSLTIVALVGLGLGEGIDTILLPSIRY